MQEMMCCKHANIPILPRTLSTSVSTSLPFVPHFVLSPEGKFQTEPERGGGDNELRSSSSSRTIEWQQATLCERMLGRELER